MQTQTQLRNAVAGVPRGAISGVLVTVHLPLRNSDELDALIDHQGDKTSSEYHRFIAPAQFDARYAPTSLDLDTAAGALRGLGYHTYATTQAILAAAPQAAVERTFGVHLKAATVDGRTTLTPDRAPTLPSTLARLSPTLSFTAHLMHPDSRRVRKSAYVPANRYGTTGPYWFTDLKQAYGYPSYQTVNGSGRTIAIVIDSDILDSDLAAYFGHELLAPPSVERRPVNGGPVNPFDLNNPSSDEASLDVQQSFGSAPGAHIMLYGIPDLSDANIFAAYSAIVDDNRADIVNSSFGLCELYYTAAYNGGTDFTSILAQFHDLYRQGNAQGITFVAASGDGGAYGCVDPSATKLVKGVENPADDPNVTAVGGTNLVTASAAPSRNSSYVRESEFFDIYDPALGAAPHQIWASGGGISEIFHKPWYQRLVPTHGGGRTGPDVGMQMGGCPFGVVQPCNPDDSSVVTAIAGNFYLFIGTSVSSPEFAGLLAVTEQSLGTRLGNANGYIYQISRVFGENVYRQDIPGNNGYPANHDYNLVVGNGTPKAAEFAAQPFAARAGDPQTPTNP